MESHVLNLGILAHVDAGKTSLTERLLHTAGVIDEVGSVDAGSTQTDTLELERRRGITIKSAVVSFPLRDRTINLIDTPGHPDFIAEVERVLGVLDGAVLVISAVEGVQAQTRVLARTLHRLRIPTLIFVTTTLCVERLTGAGEAVEFNKVPPNPFLATVGLRLEPDEPGAGVTFTLGVELGSMPLAFFTAVEQTVRDTLRQGLRGWPVPDCAVTMTHSGYSPRQSAMHAPFDKSISSTGADFRNVTPMVVMAALRRAGTVVLEPVHAFHADVPADTLPALLPELGRLGAVPLSTGPGGVSGQIPAARVHDLRRRLPALTRGEGVLESTFDHYAPVRGPAPSRERTGPDPRDRKEYLLRVMRRAGASSTSG